eukprot:jgi/Mesvir1/3209/Mv16359-RA.1
MATSGVEKLPEIHGNELKPTMDLTAELRQEEATESCFGARQFLLRCLVRHFLSETFIRFRTARTESGWNLLHHSQLKRPLCPAAKGAPCDGSGTCWVHASPRASSLACCPGTRPRRPTRGPPSGARRSWGSTRAPAEAGHLGHEPQGGALRPRQPPLSSPQTEGGATADASQPGALARDGLELATLQAALDAGVWVVACERLRRSILGLPQTPVADGGVGIGDVQAAAGGHGSNAGSGPGGQGFGGQGQGGQVSVEETALEKIGMARRKGILKADLARQLNLNLQRTEDLLTRLQAQGCITRNRGTPVTVAAGSASHAGQGATSDGDVIMLASLASKETPDGRGQLPAPSPQQAPALPAPVLLAPDASSRASPATTPAATGNDAKLLADICQRLEAEPGMSLPEPVVRKQLGFHTMSMQGQWTRLQLSGPYHICGCDPDASPSRCHLPLPTCQRCLPHPCSVRVNQLIVHRYPLIRLHTSADTTIPSDLTTVRPSLDPAVPSDDAGAGSTAAEIRSGILRPPPALPTQGLLGTPPGSLASRDSVSPLLGTGGSGDLGAGLRVESSVAAGWASTGRGDEGQPPCLDGGGVRVGGGISRDGGFMALLLSGEDDALPVAPPEKTFDQSGGASSHAGDMAPSAGGNADVGSPGASKTERKPRRQPSARSGATSAKHRKGSAGKGAARAHTSLASRAEVVSRHATIATHRDASQRGQEPRGMPQGQATQAMPAVKKELPDVGEGEVGLCTADSRALEPRAPVWAEKAAIGAATDAATKETVVAATEAAAELSRKRDKKRLKGLETERGKVVDKEAAGARGKEMGPQLAASDELPGNIRVPSLGEPRSQQLAVPREHVSHGAAGSRDLAAAAAIGFTAQVDTSSRDPAVGDMPMSMESMRGPLGLGHPASEVVAPLNGRTGMQHSTLPDVRNGMEVDSGGAPYLPSAGVGHTTGAAGGMAVEDIDGSLRASTPQPPSARNVPQPLAHPSVPPPPATLSVPRSSAASSLPQQSGTVSLRGTAASAQGPKPHKRHASGEGIGCGPTAGAVVVGVTRLPPLADSDASLREFLGHVPASFKKRSEIILEHLRDQSFLLLRAMSSSLRVRLMAAGLPLLTERIAKERVVAVVESTGMAFRLQVTLQMPDQRGGRAARATANGGKPGGGRAVGGGAGGNEAASAAGAISGSDAAVAGIAAISAAAAGGSAAAAATAAASAGSAAAAGTAAGATTGRAHATTGAAVHAAPPVSTATAGMRGADHGAPGERTPEDDWMPLCVLVHHRVDLGDPDLLASLSRAFRLLKPQKATGFVVPEPAYRGLQDVGGIHRLVSDPVRKKRKNYYKRKRMVPAGLGDADPHLSAACHGDAGTLQAAARPTKRKLSRALRSWAGGGAFTDGAHGVDSNGGEMGAHGHTREHAKGVHFWTRNMDRALLLVLLKWTEAYGLKCDVDWPRALARFGPSLAKVSPVSARRRIRRFFESTESRAFLEQARAIMAGRFRRALPQRLALVTQQAAPPPQPPPAAPPQRGEQGQQLPLVLTPPPQPQQHQGQQGGQPQQEQLLRQQEERKLEDTLLPESAASPSPEGKEAAGVMEREGAQAGVCGKGAKGMGCAASVGEGGAGQGEGQAATLGGHGAQGHGAKGHGAKGHGAKGHGAKGHGAKGHGAKGHGAKGHGAKGHGAKGHGAKGHGAKGHGAKGHGAKGHGADGHGAKGASLGATTEDSEPRANIVTPACMVALVTPASVATTGGDIAGKAPAEMAWKVQAKGKAAAATDMGREGKPREEDDEGRGGETGGGVHGQGVAAVGGNAADRFPRDASLDPGGGGGARGEAGGEALHVDGDAMGNAAGERKGSEGAGASHGPVDQMGTAVAPDSEEGNPERPVAEHPTTPVADCPGDSAGQTVRVAAEQETTGHGAGMGTAGHGGAGHGSGEQPTTAASAQWEVDCNELLHVLDLVEAAVDAKWRGLPASLVHAQRADEAPVWGDDPVSYFCHLGQAAQEDVEPVEGKEGAVSQQKKRRKRAAPVQDVGVTFSRLAVAARSAAFSARIAHRAARDLVESLRKQEEEQKRAADLAFICRPIPDLYPKLPPQDIFLPHRRPTEVAQPLMLVPQDRPTFKAYEYGGSVGELPDPRPGQTCPTPQPPMVRPAPGTQAGGTPRPARAGINWDVASTGRERLMRVLPSMSWHRIQASPQLRLSLESLHAFGVIMAVMRARSLVVSVTGASSASSSLPPSLAILGQSHADACKAASIRSTLTPASAVSHVANAGPGMGMAVDPCVGQRAAERPLMSTLSARHASIPAQGPTPNHRTEAQRHENVAASHAKGIAANHDHGAAASQGQGVAPVPTGTARGRPPGGPIGAVLEAALCVLPDVAVEAAMKMQQRRGHVLVRPSTHTPYRLTDKFLAQCAPLFYPDGLFEEAADCWRTLRQLHRGQASPDGLPASRGLDGMRSGEAQRGGRGGGDGCGESSRWSAVDEKASYGGGVDGGVTGGTGKHDRIDPIPSGTVACLLTLCALGEVRLRPVEAERVDELQGGALLAHMVDLVTLAPPQPGGGATDAPARGEGADVAQGGAGSSQGGTPGAGGGEGGDGEDGAVGKPKKRRRKVAADAALVVSSRRGTRGGPTAGAMAAHTASAVEDLLIQHAQKNAAGMAAVPTSLHTCVGESGGADNEGIESKEAKEPHLWEGVCMDDRRRLMIPWPVTVDLRGLDVGLGEGDRGGGAG